MRYVIHVGPTKTGSRAIQLFLSTNREALRAAGACYGPGVHQSYLRKVDPQAHREIIETLRRDAEAAGAQTAIVSGETMANMKPRQSAALLELLEAHGGLTSASVVYYARNVAERLVSRAAQRLKSNPRLSDEQLIEELAATASPSEQLRAMEAGFGADKVIVRSYDAATVLEADFCDAAGVAWLPDFVIPPRSNTSLDPIAGRLFGLMAEEFGVPDLFKRAADLSRGRQRLPTTERRYLELIAPLAEATDLSHPKLDPFRAAMTTVVQPDEALRPTLQAYIAYLSRLMEGAAR
jgi:hypothetical protein